MCVIIPKAKVVMKTVGDECKGRSNVPKDVLQIGMSGTQLDDFGNTAG